MEDVIKLIQMNEGAIAVMSVAIALDIVTGIIKAILSHDLKSSRFKEGMLKKCYDYILVVIAFCLDYILKVSYVSNATLYCLIAMEFYSCIENLREYVPVPEALSNALNILQKQNDTPKVDTEVNDTPQDMDESEE